MDKNLEDEQIRAEIQRAINLTKDLEEPYRSKAFEIILLRSLRARALLQTWQNFSRDKSEIDRSRV